MNSVDKYRRLGNNYHWQWARIGEANPYYRWVNQAIGYLPKDGQGDTLLDFGCGDGYPASLLVKRGFVVTGVDTLEGPLQVAREAVPEATFLMVGDDFPDESFDYVFALEVLEHMDDPTPLVDAIRSCKKYAVLTSPEPKTDEYAVTDYTIERIVALFEGCEVVQKVSDGEHRLFVITPIKVEEDEHEDRGDRQSESADETADSERVGEVAVRAGGRTRKSRASGRAGSKSGNRTQS